MGGRKTLEGIRPYANATARMYLGLPPDTTLPITETFREAARKQYHCEPQEAWASWPDAPPRRVPVQHYLVRPESATAGACWLIVSTLRLPADSDGEWLIQPTGAGVDPRTIKAKNTSRARWMGWG